MGFSKTMSRFLETIFIEQLLTLSLLSVSVENAATAHILAAKALLDPGRASGKIDWEGSIFSDGVPVPFWFQVRLILTVARGKNDLVDVIILPGWMALAIAFILEWVYWIFTLSMKKPPVAVSRTAMTYNVYTHTYNTQKARRHLRFNPIVNHDAILKAAVEWELEVRKLSKKYA
jgi:sterol-4alpha-carboxylate 3-dehydrogenase (decarboxylating)